MNFIRKYRSSAGFTLIEIMVAIIILIIGILAVSQMTIMGMQTSSVINRRMYARSALNNWFETLNSLPINHPLISDVIAGNALDDTVNTDHRTTLLNQATGNYGYDIRWNVSTGMNGQTPDARFTTIRIHVLWLNQHVNADLIRRINP
jgi:competence protein ComGC